MKTGGETKYSNPTVGFRLGAEFYAVLEEQAQELEVKPQALACAYVKRMLQEKELQASLHEVFSLIRLEITELKKDLSLAAEAILTATGNVEEKEAREWTAQNLNPGLR